MDEDRMVVNVHSRLTVVSSTPTEPIGLTHGLTPLDHAMGSHTVHIIFYYRNSPVRKKGRYAMDLDNVRISLSDLLSMYPRMTGRLVRDGDDNDNWEVKYNDAGVRMFKAHVGCTLDEWLRVADESDERNLTLWEDMPDGDPTSWSPFRIQMSGFEGGGIAIGLSFTHMLADPTSATLFFKSWTDVERDESTRHDPPIFSLPQLKTQNFPTRTTKYLKNKSKLVPTPFVKMSTSTFKFSNTMIKKCLFKMVDKCPDATPFDYLAALFWSRIIKLKTQVIPMTTHSISLCVDSRKFLDVAIPIKFFGNALNFSQLSIQNELFMSDNGLAEFVESMHLHMKKIKKEDILLANDMLETSQNGSNGEYTMPIQMYGPKLTCVSMEHLMIPKDGSVNDFEALAYKAKFNNTEKPLHVSYHLGNVEGEGLIIVAPSLEGGLARTVTVTLPIEQISILCEDPIIMELEPTMMLNGRR